MATIDGSKGVRKQRSRARQVRVGERDPRLTSAGGVEAVRELDRVLGIVDALDRQIGDLKARRRGLTGGQLLISMATAQLTGVDHLAVWTGAARMSPVRSWSR